MKRLIAITSLFSFVVVLAVSPAVATDDYVTVCLKQKKDGSPKRNTKLKRAAEGTDPGSSCKKREVEVTLPTDQLTNSLQQQISSNDDDIAALQTKTTQNMNDIAANKAAIESNDADILALQNKTTQNMNDIADNRADIDQNANDISDLQDKTTQNMNDIADNQAAIDAIATVIGGSSGTGTAGNLGTADAFEYMGPFVGRVTDSDRNVENRIPVAGTLTNFFVKQGGPDPSTGDANRVFTVLLRHSPDDPVPTDLTCTIFADEFACADDVHCWNVVANRRLTVEVDNNPNTGTLEAVKANWSAKFTPGAVCPVL